MRQKWCRFFLLAGFVSSVVSCGAYNEGENTEAEQMEQEKRQQSGQTSAELRIAKNAIATQGTPKPVKGFSLKDESTGANRGITVFLDHRATPIGGNEKSGLRTYCFEPFSDDFELGFVQCETDKKKTSLLLAKHVRIACTVNGYSQPPKEDIAIEGCDELKIFFHVFSPSLTVWLRR